LRHASGTNSLALPNSGVFIVDMKLVALIVSLAAFTAAAPKREFDLSVGLSGRGKGHGIGRDVNLPKWKGDEEEETSTTEEGDDENGDEGMERKCKEIRIRDLLEGNFGLDDLHSIATITKDHASRKKKQKEKQFDEGSFDPSFEDGEGFDLDGWSATATVHYEGDAGEHYGMDEKCWKDSGLHLVDGDTLEATLEVVMGKTRESCTEDADVEACDPKAISYFNTLADLSTNLALFCGEGEVYGLEDPQDGGSALGDFDITKKAVCSDEGEPAKLQTMIRRYFESVVDNR